MSYFYFLVKKEHAFLRNIYSHKDLSKSPSIKNLESYYAVFLKSLKIIIFMENDLNNSKTYENIYHGKL